jgi:hypothetical protein
MTNKKKKKQRCKDRRKEKMGEVERDGKAQDNGALILFLFKYMAMDTAC